MKKIIDFIKKNKANILIALTALSTVIASVATLDAQTATICSIITVLLSATISALKSGMSEATINLIASAVKIIIEQLKKDVNTDTKTVKAEKELTVEDIKNMLVAELKK